ncbi:MAG: hypothetical protein HZA88_16300 [Verrucomicrobia bacterium]|nr:hypothetical protein [Verrucomicrobiota bacterium]
MRAVIVIFGLLALCNCQGSDKSSEPYADMWRPDDSRFSPQERKIIAAARSFVEKKNKKPVDGYYKIKKTKDGYNVFVEFAAGYEHGRPLFVPGHHGIVVLRKDLSFVCYMPGE